MQPKVFTVTQAAEFLGVTRITIYNWIKRKKIAVTQVGPRTSIITMAELERVKAALKAREEAF